MRWRRAGEPVQQPTVDDLRHLADHDERYRRPLGIALLELAMTALEDQRAVGLTLIQECVTTLRVTEPPDGAPVDMALVTALGLLASEQFQRGELDEARVVLEEALDRAEDHAASSACAETHRAVMVHNLVMLARCREIAGDPHGARRLADQAFLVLEPIAERPELGTYRTALTTLAARLPR